MATMASSILVPTTRERYVELGASRDVSQLHKSLLVIAGASGSQHRSSFQLLRITAPQGRTSRDVSARAWWSRSKAVQEEPVVTETSKPAEVAKNVKASKKQAAAAVAPPAPPPEEEEEVEISWAQEKAEELVQLTGNAIQAIPGPRVGESSMPWLLALPLTYLGITFVIAVYRTIKKHNSPKAKKRRMIGKNAFLVTSLDKYFPDRRKEFDAKALKELERKCNFDSEEVLRKYIRYVMNERPFTPDTVADLIHLRKVTKLADEEVAEVLNETSRRIVNEKGTVMMDMRGLTEKGIQRKVVVRALFSKLLYLSELDEFCATSKEQLKIKEIFGVTDEDANSLRIETLSQLSDIESLDKLVETETTTTTDQDSPDAQSP